MPRTRRSPPAVAAVSAPGSSQCRTRRRRPTTCAFSLAHPTFWADRRGSRRCQSRTPRCCRRRRRCRRRGGPCPTASRTLPVAGGLVERVLRVEALVEGGAVRATRLQLVVAQLQREGMFPVTERGLVLCRLQCELTSSRSSRAVGPAGRRAAGGAVQVGVPPGAVVEFLRGRRPARGVVAHVRAVRKRMPWEAFDLSNAFSWSPSRQSCAVLSK